MPLFDTHAHYNDDAFDQDRKGLLDALPDAGVGAVVIPGVRGVFHCFSGSPEMAEELLKRGWYLGFDGPVTYKNARRAPEVVAVTPLDRIVVETDAPYMSPVPNRGRRNDSRNLPYIVEKLAEWKGISPEEMAAHTWNNGLRLFGLEGKV